MKLDISSWDRFEYDHLFNIHKGFYSKKPDDSSVNGTIRFLGATSRDNGVTAKYTKETIQNTSKNDKSPNVGLDKKIYPAHAVCITSNGSVGYAYYQNKPFTCSSDISVLYRKNGQFDVYTGLFVATIIMYDRYRWGWGRKWGLSSIKKSTLILPIKHNSQGLPIVDHIKNYNNKGHVPDWEYMGKYMHSLKWGIIKTNNLLKNVPKLNTTSWKAFALHNIFKLKIGNKIDACTVTSDNPRFNYVARTGNNNGVNNFIDKIKGQKPFPTGTITLAFGGTLGSCFVQPRQFYTAQNVGILEAPQNVTLRAKLFMITLIERECHIRFQPFGRELNSHFKTDLSIKLPIKHDFQGLPVIDKTHKFNLQGYIPDWDYMDKYIGKLPYGDKL